MSNKKILAKKTYTLGVTIFDDNTTELSRLNDGFTALELLGLLEKIQLEIMQQMSAEIKPDVIKRTIIED